MTTSVALQDRMARGRALAKNGGGGHGRNQNWTDGRPGVGGGGGMGGGAARGGARRGVDASAGMGAGGGGAAPEGKGRFEHLLGGAAAGMGAAGLATTFATTAAGAAAAGPVGLAAAGLTYAGLRAARALKARADARRQARLDAMGSNYNGGEPIDNGGASRGTRPAPREANYNGGEPIDNGTAGRHDVQGFGPFGAKARQAKIERLQTELADHAEWFKDLKEARAKGLDVSGAYHGAIFRRTGAQAKARYQLKQLQERQASSSPTARPDVQGFGSFGAGERAPMTDAGRANIDRQIAGHEKKIGDLKREIAGHDEWLDGVTLPAQYMTGRQISMVTRKREARQYAADEIKRRQSQIAELQAKRDGKPSPAKEKADAQRAARDKHKADVDEAMRSVPRSSPPKGMDAVADTMHTAAGSMMGAAPAAAAAILASGGAAAPVLAAGAVGAGLTAAGMRAYRAIKEQRERRRAAERIVDARERPTPSTPRSDIFGLGRKKTDVSSAMKPGRGGEGQAREQGGVRTGEEALGMYRGDRAAALNELNGRLQAARSEAGRGAEIRDIKAAIAHVESRPENAPKTDAYRSGEAASDRHEQLLARLKAQRATREQGGPSPSLQAARERLMQSDRVKAEADRAEEARVGQEVSARRTAASATGASRAEQGRAEYETAVRGAGLTGQQRKMFDLLRNNPGRTFSKKEIVDHVYGHDPEIDPKMADVLMSATRKKIAAATGGEHNLETDFGNGYAYRDPYGARQSGGGEAAMAERAASAGARTGAAAGRAAAAKPKFDARAEYQRIAAGGETGRYTPAQHAALSRQSIMAASSRRDRSGAPHPDDSAVHDRIVAATPAPREPRAAAVPRGSTPEQHADALHERLTAMHEGRIEPRNDIPGGVPQHLTDAYLAQVDQMASEPGMTTAKLKAVFQNTFGHATTEKTKANIVRDFQSEAVQGARWGSLGSTVADAKARRAERDAGRQTT